MSYIVIYTFSCFRFLLWCIFYMEVEKFAASCFKQNICHFIFGPWDRRRLSSHFVGSKSQSFLTETFKMNKKLIFTLSWKKLAKKSITFHWISQMFLIMHHFRDTLYILSLGYLKMGLFEYLRTPMQLAKLKCFPIFCFGMVSDAKFS